MQQTEDPSGLPPVPASVRTVLRELGEHQPMTGKQLREATGLPRRTVYTALRKLRELGVLRERQSLRDTRQTYFWVSQPGKDEPDHHEKGGWSGHGPPGPRHA
jgi:DNA-binding transcriptional ArsR family regulator